VPRATSKREVLLAWALDREGRRVPAASLDAAGRRARRPFRCLGCGEELLAKLGPVRARHFAHRPGSTCPLARPETALHLNAKERLLWLCGEAFAGRLRVRLGARCPRCRRTAPLEVAAIGDSAAPEAALGSLRCDLLVSRGGKPALAFEVRVTHAVDEAKEAALARLGLPTLEIDAREGWEQALPHATPGAGPHGVPDGVLVACSRTLGMPPCSACATQARAEVGRALGGEEAALAELEDYRARGLMGPPPDRPIAAVPPWSETERAGLARSFRCPDCGSQDLAFGDRIVRHACGEAALSPARTVAWRGYDGAVVQLAWWQKGG